MLAFANTLHDKIGTWKYKIDKFIVVNSFTKELLQQKGIAENKIAFKPNFVVNKTYNDYTTRSDFYLFAGRLSEEKGIRYLIDAFKKNQKQLVIAGDGDLKAFVQNNCSPNIQYVGLKNAEEMTALMLQAKALVFTSIWIEAMPMIIIEAMASGLIPIIASSINTTKMLSDSKEGFIFHPTSLDLFNKINEFEQLEFATLQNISNAARARFELQYSEQAHLSRIDEIYTG